MDITIKKSERLHHIEAQKKYYQTVIAPLDDMWELGIIAKANYFAIYSEELLGYLVLNDDQVLLQFYVDASFEHLEDVIYRECLLQLKIKAAYACTYEPNYLGLSLAEGVDYEFKGILYKHVLKKRIKRPVEGLVEVIATHEDLEAAIDYTNNDVEISGDWLRTYYLFLLETDSLYLYKLNDEIIGTGEIRPSTTYYPAANIGMTVSSKHRKKNIGTYILNRMAEVAFNMALQPICGTDIENIPSQKTIKKCGFKPYHRIFKVYFHNEVVKEKSC